MPRFLEKKLTGALVTDSVKPVGFDYGMEFAARYVHEVKFVSKSALGDFVKREPLDIIFGQDHEIKKIADEYRIPFIPFDYGNRIGCYNENVKYDEPQKTHRILIMGCESTGKSEMVEGLAKKLGGYFTEEYARSYFHFYGDKGTIQDIPRTSLGQIATEKAYMGTQHPPFLFCDTDLLLTSIWSEFLFGNCPDWIYEKAYEQKAELTLLMDIDLPWIPDPQRCLPDIVDRRKFQERCMEALEDLNRPYVLISGDEDIRVEKAVDAIKEHFKSKRIELPTKN